MNELELKTELKIAMYWIRGTAAKSGAGLGCMCGAVFAIADSCMTTPRRKALFQSDAPDWVKKAFPQYDFVHARLKEPHGKK